MKKVAKISILFLSTSFLFGCADINRSQIGSSSSDVSMNFQSSHIDSINRLNSVISEVMSSSGITQNELTRYLNKMDSSTATTQSNLIKTIDHSVETAKQQINKLDSFNVSDASKSEVKQLRELLIRYCAIGEILKEAVASNDQASLEAANEDFGNCVRSISQHLHTTL